MTLKEKEWLGRIARKAYRIRAKNERWEELNEIIKQRAADPALAHVPGGSSGLLKPTRLRVVGTGDDKLLVWECRLDVALLTEMRRLEQQVAQELGQWGKPEPQDSRPEPLDLTRLSDIQLEQLGEILAAAGQSAPHPEDPASEPAADASAPSAN